MHGLPLAPGGQEGFLGEVFGVEGVADVRQAQRIDQRRVRVEKAPECSLVDVSSPALPGHEIKRKSCPLFLRIPKKIRRRRIRFVGPRIFRLAESPNGPVRPHIPTSFSKESSRKKQLTVRIIAMMLQTSPATAHPLRVEDRPMLLRMIDAMSKPIRYRR